MTDSPTGRSCHYRKISDQRAHQQPRQPLSISGTMDVRGGPVNSQDKTQPIPAIEPPAVPCQRKRIQGFRGPGMNPGHVWCHPWNHKHPPPRRAVGSCGFSSCMTVAACIHLHVPHPITLASLLEQDRGRSLKEQGGGGVSRLFRGTSQSGIVFNAARLRSVSLPPRHWLAL